MAKGNPAHTVARHRGHIGKAIVALASALLAACATRPPGSAPTTSVAITNVQVIDTTIGAVATGQTILIADNTIVAITAASTPLPPVARRIDGKGAFAIPGLWDAHVHVLQADADTALARTAPVLLGHGITHVRDMGSSTSALSRYKSLAGTPKAANSPVILGGGPAVWAFELPYGDKDQQVFIRQPEDTEAVVTALARAGADFVKVYAGFDAGGLTRLSAAARANGLTITGHAQPNQRLDAQAMAGLRVVEHLDLSLFTGCGPDPEATFARVIAARFRNSGETLPAIFAGFAGALDRSACLPILKRAAEAGLVLTPTLGATFLPPAIARARLATLPPDQRDNCALYLNGFGPPDATAEAAYLTAGATMLGLIRDAGIPLLAGTDTPAFCSAPGAALANELALLRDAGLSPLDVLQSATLNAARAFGQADRLGALTAGREAHVLLLPTNPLADITAYTRPVGLFTQGAWRDEAALEALRVGTQTANPVP